MQELATNPDPNLDGGARAAAQRAALNCDRLMSTGPGERLRVAHDIWEDAGAATGPYRGGTLMRPQAQAALDEAQELYRAIEGKSPPV